MNVRNALDKAAGAIFDHGPLVDAIVRDDVAYGRRRTDEETLALGAKTDLFELYEKQSGGREPQPPHFVFAYLDAGEPEEIAGFLRAFGPLHEPDLRAQMSSAQVQEKTGTAGLAEGDWVAVDLKSFRAERAEFEVLLQLAKHVVHRRNGDSVRAVLKPFASTKRVPECFSLMLLDLWKALAFGTQPGSGRALREILARELEKPNARVLRVGSRLLAYRLNARLERVRPWMFLGTDGRLRPSWLCDDLLEALYLMLRLDCDRELRIVRCPGCKRLFVAPKENVGYCSKSCSGRHRYRKWYRTGGRERLAQRRASRGGV